MSDRLDADLETGPERIQLALSFVAPPSQPHPKQVFAIGISVLPSALARGSLSGLANHPSSGLSMRAVNQTENQHVEE